MEQNKTGRYLKYAIGEIILVVIGILIALQFNNWNQERNNRQKEVSYMLEIKSSLQEDSKIIQDILKFNKEKIKTVQAFMSIFSSKLTNPERFEIINTNSYSFTQYEFFVPKATTWNNLIASENIDLLKNTSIRRHLMEYYSFDYSGSVQERIKIMNRKVIDENFPKFFTKEYALKNLNIETDLPSESEFDLHKNQVFISDLYGIQYLINLQNEFLKATDDNIQEIIKLIDTKIIQSH